MTANIIPNATPWTELFEVYIEACDGEVSTGYYPIVGWRIEDECTVPVIFAAPVEDGPRYAVPNNELTGYVVHALHNPSAGIYNESQYGGRLTEGQIIESARYLLEAEKNRQARSMARSGRAA